MIITNVRAAASESERAWGRPKMVGEVKKKSVTTIVMKMAGRRVIQ